MKRLIAALTLITAAGAVLAQATPVGLWKTVDDETKAEKSLVRISEAGGVLSAKVEKIADASKQDSKCEACTDERKDKPVLGMSIVRNAKLNADQSAWEGGEILDPNNGKVYKLRMSLVDGGKKLDVRGFIGFALLGRTQTWLRVE